MNSWAGWLGSALIVVTMVGCAGPRPEPPAVATVEVPTTWRESASAASLQPLNDWLMGFNDPALANLVEHALAKNIDISIAATRVAEARAQFQLSRAQRGIDIAAAGGGIRERSISAFGVPVEQSAGEASVSVAYDADLFGRLSNASAAARAALLATEAA